MFLSKVKRLASRQSLKLKLTFLFVFIFGATTVLFNVTLFFYMMKALEDDYDIALYNYAVDITNSVNIGPSATSSNFSKLALDQGKILPFPLGNAVVFLRNNQGQVISQFGDELKDFVPSFEKDFKKLANGEEASYQTITYSSNEADTYRVISLALDENKKFYIQIAAPLTLLEKQIDKRFDLLLLGIPIVLLIAAAVGFLLSSRALRPIREMIESTQKLDVSDLSKRVPVAETQDEIQQLGFTVNQMLGRIEKAFLSQDRFVADASHQLQTPLAILKGELEQTIRQNSTDPQVKASIISCLQEVDGLSQIVTDMLLLARIDSGRGSLKKREVYLDELLIDLVSRIGKKNESIRKQLKLNLVNPESRCVAHCDPELITHALSNVIENAVKYSPQETSIYIDLEWGPQSTFVRIRDEGPGISEQFKDQLFKRFSRESLSSNRVSGFGLGLAISKRIADLHDIQLSASNNPQGGALFRFEIKNF